VWVGRTERGPEWILGFRVVEWKTRQGFGCDAIKNRMSTDRILRLARKPGK
jgi:hypothetical protein